MEATTVRYQDFSMEQALGIAVRASLRVFPLIRLKEEVESNGINKSLSCVLNVYHFLMDISIGNQNKKDFSKQALEYYKFLENINIITGKYPSAIEPLFLILDQVSGQNIIRVIERPGLQTRDNKNIRLAISCDTAKQVFRESGLIEDIFSQQIISDYNYLNSIPLYDNYLPEIFFNRPLWISNDEKLKMSFFPIWNGIITKEWEDYLNQYFLSGIISSYKGLLGGIRLTKKEEIEEIEEVEEEIKRDNEIIEKPNSSNKILGWVALFVSLILIFIFLLIFIFQDWKHNFMKMLMDWADAQPDLKKDILIIPISALFTGTWYLLGTVFYKNIIKRNKD